MNSSQVTLQGESHMDYKQEKESLQKYGEKVTSNLIKRQQEYEKEQKDNKCMKCGKGNQGSIVEWNDGTPFLMHYGLWTAEGVCHFCGKDQ
ncbi:hypothetical protein [Alicyclobacillus fodiniaquatilis]|uniref:Uncharacterized protein n=1 Tax=Alicyclobacillus fodiniaquatilis TaxID=1661150 RepID=A0ABW4JLX9_9BACL